MKNITLKQLIEKLQKLDEKLEPMVEVYNGKTEEREGSGPIHSVLVVGNKVIIQCQASW